MKKSILIASLLFIGLASCKKAYVCECVNTYKPTGEEFHLSFGVTANRKSIAEKACKVNEDESLLYKNVCELK
jgi:hypothetical protein